MDIMKIIRFPVFLLLLTMISYSPLIMASKIIEVQALMPGMVVLLINDERVTLKNDSPSVQGVKLFSSSTQSAVLEIDGEKKTVYMGSAVSTQFSQREIISEQIIADKYGMFRAHGSINGQSIKFLIDTGASSVAMSAKEARRLGIQYRLKGKPIKTNTASGIANGWALNLDSVSLGPLVEKNVRGTVIDGDYPYQVLLGMTFLNRMKVDKEGNKMVISQKQ
jgi:aspartyl protease family protein